MISSPFRNSGRRSLLVMGALVVAVACVPSRSDAGENLQSFALAERLPSPPVPIPLKDTAAGKAETAEVRATAPAGPSMAPVEAQKDLIDIIKPTN